MGKNACIKRIIIVGPGASGKDFLLEEFRKEGYKCAIRHTTRPIREGEIDGENYHFVDAMTFAEMSFHGKLVEIQHFNIDHLKEIWYYGTSRKEFDECEAIILTPSGVKQLSEKDKNESWIVYLNIPEDIRRFRLSKRGDVDDVERRLAADKKDFEDFNEFQYATTFHDFYPSNFTTSFELLKRKKV